MNKHRDRQIDAPQPDDPIFAAFGIDPEDAELTRASARRARPVLRVLGIAALAVTALVAGSLLLRPQHMAAHADTVTAPATATPAAATLAGTDKAFNDAMTKAMMDMHMAMDQPYSGNPDRDFASMMIPHHQGAIDMAKLELQYGKDPRLRRLAEEIIVTQQQEIVVMQMVLKDLAASQPSPNQPSTAPAAGMQMNGMDMNGMQMNSTPGAPASSSTTP